MTNTSLLPWVSVGGGRGGAVVRKFDAQSEIYPETRRRARDGIEGIGEHVHLHPCEHRPWNAVRARSGMGESERKCISVATIGEAQSPAGAKISVVVPEREMRVRALMNPPRLSAFTAMVLIAIFVIDAQAAPFIYEPFDYAGTVSNDVNQDGKKHLRGLAGGTGWFNAWTELTVLSPALSTHPLDYVVDNSLNEPTGDSRFSLGGSLRMTGFASASLEGGNPNQSTQRLRRTFASPIQLDDRSELWFSILVRKEYEYPDQTTQLTHLRDRLEISLMAEDNQPIAMVTDPTTSTSYAINSVYTTAGEPDYVDNRGPIVGTTDLLVLKLTLSPANYRLELFLNPSLDAEPTLPAAELPLHENVTMGELLGIEILTTANLANRPVWSVDEIRISGTYADVIPEPSSLLLTGFGIAMFGGARLRRSSVVRG